MPNALQQFNELLDRPPLLVGTVLSSASNNTRVQLSSGAVIVARGTASIGASVYVQNGLVQGTAPNLPHTEIEI